MIPNLKRGRSFKGAGLYYLHDKAPRDDAGKRIGPHPTTSERVAWTRTLNCVNDDPEAALAEMMATYWDRDRLKREAGLAPGGRPVEQPVKTVSLSWHPDERPDQAAMEAAAVGYLRHMGWQEHQALLVAHDDTEHAHLHIILNRIHPDTGRTLNDWQEYRRSQAWALQYEREHGRIFCHAREGKYGPEATIDAETLARQAAEAMRDAERPGWNEEATRGHTPETFEELKARQRAEREAWFEDGRAAMRERRQDVFREVREEFKAHWREHHDWAAEHLAEARGTSQNAAARAFHFARRGDFEAAWNAVGDRDAAGKAALHDIQSDRAELAGAQKRITRDLQEQALDALRAEREDAYRALLDRQQEERDIFRRHGADGLRRMDREHDAAEHAGDHRQAANDNDYRAIGIDRDAAPEAAPVRQAAERSTPVEIEIAATPSAHTVATDRLAGGVAEFGASAIGGLASYLADQMAELFAPTPPEVRDAQTKAAAAAASERQARKDAEANLYARAAEAAVKRAEAEHEQQRGDRYWEERERQRER